MNIIRISLFMLLIVHYCGVSAITIDHVYHEPDPDNERQTRILFSLSEKADVLLQLYDDRELLIRELSSEALNRGENLMVWDGRDESLTPVPSEVYRYVIRAKTTNGDHTEYDVSDLTGNKKTRLKNFRWNYDDNIFEYVLQEPSRVLVRIGIKNRGPLLGTVLNWVPQRSGKHFVKWDGMDMSSVLDLAKHPNLMTDVQAYSLSANSIILGTKIQGKEYVTISWDKKTRTKSHIKRKVMVAAYQQKAETRGDYPVHLKIIGGSTNKNIDGIAVVSGVLAIMVQPDRANLSVALNRRVEPVFFVDGQFSYENEVGYLPMTLRLDTKQINDGEHYITVNVRGYEGNFGIATIKVIIDNSNG